MKWHNRFLSIAETVGTWSKDLSTQVGVVVTEDNHIMATGFNGVPRRIEDKPEYYTYPLKNHYVIHAEVNAILNLTKAINDSMIMYTTRFPCCDCAIFLIQAGVRHIVSYHKDDDFYKRWKESIDTSKIMFKDAGVTLQEISYENKHTQNN